MNPVLIMKRKVQIETETIVASMLEKHLLTLSQAAEYKESLKWGSFTTLSSLLGQKIMQSHTGLALRDLLVSFITVVISIVIEVYCIFCSVKLTNGLLSTLFKVILLWISATPYGCMPPDLLPTTIVSLHLKMKDILLSKNSNSDLLVNALSCLGASFSRSPPSLYVLKLLEDDLSQGSSHTQPESTLIYLLFNLAEKRRQASVVYEALQTLRTVSHNYPRIGTRLWGQVSDTVQECLHIGGPYGSISEVGAGSCKEEFSKAIGVTTEKCIMASVKVLDECLRAVSGFKGVDDFQDLRLLDIRHISDCTGS